MEHIQEYLPEYMTSNSIAVVVLLLAWKKPTAARVAFGIIFFSASIANTYHIVYLMPW